MKVSVVGLGKLGAPLAAVMASRGHEVVGLDISQRFVDDINAGRAPVQEPQLQELITESNGRLRATTDWNDLAAHSEISFLIVPTPSDKNGVFVNTFVLDAIDKLGAAIRGKSGYHVVVITSTVMPGSTNGIIRQRLESASGRKVGPELGLCYNPEFIALGTVVRDMLYPDVILIGQSDQRAGDYLEEVYKTSAKNDPAVQRMNFINAELVKISVNTYVTTKISYANMISEICGQLPEADVDVVTTALGKDSRIGGKYLKGATGYGGPCFPRDNVALSVFARSLGVSPDVAEATDRVNRRQFDRLAHLTLSHIQNARRVGIVGLSYKPGTPVIEESQAIFLARRLLEMGVEVALYDPHALDNAMNALPTAIRANSLEHCVSSSDAIVIMTNEPEYNLIDPMWMKRKEGTKVVVVDTWRVLPRETFSEIATLVYPGYGQEQLSGDAATGSVAAE
jgi:UDPglucose 6-dehydrogenase